MLKHEKSEEEIKILDFGCGDGNTVLFIRKHFPKATIFGIDVSEKSIDEAKAKQIHNTDF